MAGEAGKYGLAMAEVNPWLPFECSSGGDLLPAANYPAAQRKRPSHAWEYWGHIPCAKADYGVSGVCQVMLCSPDRNLSGLEFLHLFHSYRQDTIFKLRVNRFYVDVFIKLDGSRDRSVASFVNGDFDVFAGFSLFAFGLQFKRAFSQLQRNVVQLDTWQIDKYLVSLV